MPGCRGECKICATAEACAVQRRVERDHAAPAADRINRCQYSAAGIVDQRASDSLEGECCARGREGRGVKRPRRVAGRRTIHGITDEICRGIRNRDGSGSCAGPCGGRSRAPTTAIGVKWSSDNGGQAGENRREDLRVAEEGEKKKQRKLLHG